MEKILVVDNDSNILEQIREDFKPRTDLLIYTANSVHAAIAILQKENISLLATAVHLPETDGLDLLAYMTRKFTSTPCIVMLV